MQNISEWATIGTIVAPFGIRGELKVFSLSDIPDRFTSLQAVYVGPGHARYRVEHVRPYKGNVYVLKLAGVHDATTGDTLRRQDLFIPLENLAELPADSYYQHDILGLRVLTLEGQEIGTIEDIIQTGSNDVYVVKGVNGKQILIPALKDVVRRIDLSGSSMYIDPMEGMLDDDVLK